MKAGDRGGRVKSKKEVKTWGRRRSVKARGSEWVMIRRCSKHIRHTSRFPWRADRDIKVKLSQLYW